MFKSRENFESGKGVCYIPEGAEWEDDKFTREDILKVCFDNEDLAELVFDLLNWTYPSTMVEELKEDILDAPYAWGLEKAPQSEGKIRSILKNYHGQLE